MVVNTKLSCPSITLPSLARQEKIIKLSVMLGKLDLSLSDPVASIGMEQRVAMLALRRGEIENHKLDDACSAKYQALLLRPPIEPIFYAFRKQINLRSIDSDNTDNLVSALLGYKCRKRTGRSFGSSIYGNVEFDSEDYVEKWQNSLNSLKFDASMNIFHAICGYATTIICHPYEDGNGRLARVIMIMYLNFCIGAEYPIIPISPSLYRN
jgi:hypothetical protein